MTDKLPADPFPQLPRRSFFVADDPKPLRHNLAAQVATLGAESLLPPDTPKRGRPPANKPWIEAGVSRMTWYRRQKAARGDH